MAVKYVSLLAFNKIARSHSSLVSEQDEVIIACIDDADISIRLQALNLISSISSADNLVSTVERLLVQLEYQPGNVMDDVDAEHSLHGNWTAHSNNHPGLSTLRSPVERRLMPIAYRTALFSTILSMGSRSMYGRIEDFDWYINVLLRLLKAALDVSMTENINALREDQRVTATITHDVFDAIGWQLRDIAVRVDVTRAHAVSTAVAMLKLYSCEKAEKTLGSAAWVVGEYVQYAHDTLGALSSLLHCTKAVQSSEVVYKFVQAIIKVFARWLSESSSMWSIERHRDMVLRRRQIIDILDPLASHPDLEVQERSVEFLELLKLAEGSIEEHPDGIQGTVMMLSQCLPPLFAKHDLRPVAPGAQKKVPVPAKLDLQKVINSKLASALELESSWSYPVGAASSFAALYSIPLARYSESKAQLSDFPSQTYVPHRDDDRPSFPEGVYHGNKKVLHQPDDPFYLAFNGIRTNHIVNAQQGYTSQVGEGVDIDSIPIVDLSIDSTVEHTHVDPCGVPKQRSKSVKAWVAPDTDIGDVFSEQRDREAQNLSRQEQSSKSDHERPGREVCGTESTFSVLVKANSAAEGAEGIDQEMSMALAEVERHRLEMQRASDRVEAAEGAPADGTLVKKRVRRKVRRKKGDHARLEDN